MTDFIIVEGWCVYCGESLDGLPIDGPEAHPECMRTYEEMEEDS